MKLTSFAVASDTTIIKATCGSPTCDGHTYAKDAKGWHCAEPNPLIRGKIFWDPVTSRSELEDLNKLLEQAEAEFTKEKK